MMSFSFPQLFNGWCRRCWKVGKHEVTQFVVTQLGSSANTLTSTTIEIMLATRVRFPDRFSLMLISRNESSAKRYLQYGVCTRICSRFAIIFIYYVCKLCSI